MDLAINSRLHENSGHAQGFTLVELSIVLVIIGLIIGGLLAGQDLIKSAEIRATITQIERYNAAVNAFKVKYGYIPGDIPDPYASQFGFIARGSWEGEGDGNGIIEGNCGGQNASGFYCQKTGETTVFWVDLSTAGLIEGKFNTAVSNGGWGSITGSTGIPFYLPKAKINDYLYFYAMSNSGQNYFMISNVSQIDTSGFLTTNVGLTVSQAYVIDKKLDDGLPATGNIQALYLNSALLNYWPVGAAGAQNAGAALGTPVAGTPTTCYDNGFNSANPMQYSTEINNGNYVNCALSFAMQGAAR